MYPRPPPPFSPPCKQRMHPCLPKFFLLKILDLIIEKAVVIPTLWTSFILVLFGPFVLSSLIFTLAINSLSGVAGSQRMLVFSLFLNQPSLFFPSSLPSGLPSRFLSCSRGFLLPHLPSIADVSSFPSRVSSLPCQLFSLSTLLDILPPLSPAGKQPDVFLYPPTPLFQINVSPEEKWEETGRHLDVFQLEIKEVRYPIGFRERIIDMVTGKREKQMDRGYDFLFSMT
jgi:hypothetical protein